MLCENPDHERWRGIMFATNGCLACHCEEQSVLIAELEAKAERLSRAIVPINEAIRETCGDVTAETRNPDYHCCIAVTIRDARALMAGSPTARTGRR